MNKIYHLNCYVLSDASAFMVDFAFENDFFFFFLRNESDNFDIPLTLIYIYNIYIYIKGESPNKKN